MKRGPKTKRISSENINKICQLIGYHLTLTKALKYTKVSFHTFYKKLTPRQARQIDEAKALTLTEGAWRGMVFNHKVKQ